VLIHVRYSEISLKGGRRGWYEDYLRENVARQLDVRKRQIQRTRGRLLVDLPGVDDPREPLEVLRRVFGIASVSVILQAPEDTFEALLPLGVELAKLAAARGGKTFKVEARRADKSFPMSSYEICRELGAAIFVALDEQVGVDVHEPEFTISVEVRGEGIFVYSDSDSVLGPGGLPTGTSGRALCLLSGGIDSPVAAAMAMKRGLHTDCVYYHASPYTGPKVLEKVLTIARTLSRWTPKPLRVFVPSTTKIQDRIAERAPEPLRIVLLRRSMYRIAERIREAREHKALVTGESLGQVASQTPENLLCVEAVVPNTLVLRPLLGLDKQEIVTRAEALGTYETSILPHQDCCSLFAPSRPATQVRVDECEQEEAGLDLAPLEEASLEALDVYWINRGAAWDKSPEGLHKRRSS